MSRKSLVPIVLPGDPTQPLEATPKQYVDAVEGDKDAPPPLHDWQFLFDPTEASPGAGAAIATVPYMKIGIAQDGAIPKLSTGASLPALLFSTGSTHGFSTNAPQYFQSIDTSRIRIQPGYYGILLSFSIRQSGATGPMPWGTYGRTHVNNVAAGDPIPGGGSVIVSEWTMTGARQPFALNVLFAASSARDLYVGTAESDTANAAQTWTYGSYGNNLTLWRFADYV